MPNYRITRLAARDLDAIAAYIARDNASAAVYTILQFIEKFELLAAKPETFPAYPPIKGLRKHTVGNYIVFYRKSRRGIDIIRVLHGARDVSKLLS